MKLSKRLKQVSPLDLQEKLILIKPQCDDLVIEIENLEQERDNFKQEFERITDLFIVQEKGVMKGMQYCVQLEKDRNIWKKACVLLREAVKDRFAHPIEYWYEAAKAELEKEND